MKITGFFRSRRASLLFWTSSSLWILLVWPFIVSAVLYFDAKQYSSYINYFLNAVFSGTYPSWDPFNLFGRPDGLFGRISGDNNPFLFFILILQKSGVPYPQAYVLFYAAYFLFGMQGFFVLARIFLRDILPASAAFLFLLFSSFSFCLFNDAQVIMIFVPAVWGIYFLRMFWRRPSQKTLWAAIFWLDVLLMMYLPFFILTIFIVLICGLLLFYPSSVLAGFRRLIVFFSSRPTVLVAAFLLFLAGFAPAFFVWLMVRKGEWMLDWRSVSAVGKSLMQVDWPAIVNNGYIPYYFSPHYWFSCLNGDVFARFYVSTTAACFFVVGFLGSVTRRMVFLVAVFFFLFLIGIGSACGLHAFLYQHIPYFRLFRNLHFLLWMTVPFAVFVCAEVFRSSLVWFMASRIKWFKGLLITIVSMVFSIFLWRFQTHVVWTIYAGVVFAWMMFMVVLWFPARKGWALLLLFVSVTVPASDVFLSFVRNEKKYIHEYVPPVWTEGFSPVFSWQRPSRNVPWPLREVEGYGSVRDSSGFDYPRFTGSRWAGELLAKYSVSKIESYTANKFIVYERGFSVDGSDNRAVALDRIFSGQCGGALIEDGGRGSFLDADKGCAGKAVVLKDSSSEFRVLSFGLNGIRFDTNWPVEKYLVYNDTWSVSWRARLNGRDVGVDRVNVAFKGIKLPAGRNVVEMIYDLPLKNFLRLVFAWSYVLFLVFVSWPCVRFSWFRKIFFRRNV